VTQATGTNVDFDGLFASIDAMDTERFVAFIAEDGTFRYGSSPPVTGRDGIRAAVEGFFGSIGGLKHDVQRTVSAGDVVVCEGEVSYTRLDGSKITLPFANVFDVEAGMISGYRVYIDIGPLYAT